MRVLRALVLDEMTARIYAPQITEVGLRTCRSLFFMTEAYAAATRCSSSICARARERRAPETVRADNDRSQSYQMPRTNTDCPISEPRTKMADASYLRATFSFVAEIRPVIIAKSAGDAATTALYARRRPKDSFAEHFSHARHHTKCCPRAVVGEITGRVASHSVVIRFNTPR